MIFSAPATEVIKRRYSCRSYAKQAISRDVRHVLSEFLASNTVGPLGSRGRFVLVAATEEDSSSLKGLGTYGFVKDPPAFIVGVIEKGPRALEDFGYLFEHAILRATDLELGTCWLGGSFTRSRFARRISPTEKEFMPAVVSVGYFRDRTRYEARVRGEGRSPFRLPPEELFFEDDFRVPVAMEAAGHYGVALEMVRRGPSASNKQPWRILHTATGWHFYVERTKGYGKGSLLFRVLRLADLQRVDVGIAMCHFELTLRELGVTGSWVVDPPSVELPRAGMEYAVTWRAAQLQSAIPVLAETRN